MTSTNRLLAIALAIVLSVAACTSSKTDGRPSSSPPSSRSSTTALPSTASISPTVDPRARPAVNAYLNFWDAVHRAYERPFGPNGKKPTSDEDFRRFSVDPAQSSTLRYVWGLAAAGHAYRGAPPQPRVRVAAINLSENPWPTVLIDNCPTTSSWQLISVRTGKPVATVAPPSPPKAQPPYRVSVKVIYYKGQWSVYEMNADGDHTCAAM